MTNTETASKSLAPTFRILRLMRVVRIIRGLKVLYSLWMIIQGLLDSLRTVLWVSVLLVLILYCMAVSLAATVGQEEYVKERWRYSDQYVGTVFRSMWTVIQVVTLDNWAEDIARPLNQASPVATILLILCIIVCYYGLLNIIIAVMIERMQITAKESKDNTSKILKKTENSLLESMVEDFRNNDVMDSGELDFPSFKVLIRTPTFQNKLRLLGVQSEEAEGLFECMDADQSGSVSSEEFVKGILKLRGVAKGADLVQVICFCQKQCLRASRFCERLKLLNEQADKVRHKLDSVGHRITHEIRDRKKATARNDEVWRDAASRTAMISKLDLSRKIGFPSLREFDL